MVQVFVLTIALFTSSGLAQQWPWSADDFEPLTSLPWKSENDPVVQVITRIFREPRIEVRQAVLRSYLRMIPLKEFEAALALCAKFDGNNHPDDVIGLVLCEWAQRDPSAAWKRTQELFDACVIQGEPLSLDSWNNPRITVGNADAFQKSPFWLDGSATMGFILGAEKIGSLPRAKRQEILYAFTHRYIELFAAAPRVVVTHDPSNPGNTDQTRDREIVQTLTCEHNDLTWIKDKGLPPIVYDVAAIRWLAAEPYRAEHILEKTTVEPSAWFLQTWKRLDLDAMKAWTEATNIESHHGAEARGMLMSTVDAATRQRWLAEEELTGGGADDSSPLLNAWAIWNPAEALTALATLKPKPPAKGQSQEQADDNLKNKVGTALLQFVSTWDQPLNRGLYGMKVLADADWTKFPDVMTRAVIEEHGIEMMEWWVEADVGQAARFAFKLITSRVAQDLFPREEMIKEFAGGEPFSGDDFNDRCFCALRFWAAWKPNEMKAWIATVEGEDMRKALLWLLEHPWGKGPGPE